MERQAEQLLAAILADACVLTYNHAFEKSVLRNLAELFPDLAEAIEARLSNVRDLIGAVSAGDVYRCQMLGSHSIKQVLPAMVPEFSYAAMRAYHEMCALEPEAALERLRMEYCRLDTLAMMKILEALGKVAGSL